MNQQSPEQQNRSGAPKTCVLNSLSSPTLTGMAPGIRLDSTVEVIAVNDLPCCQGAGVYFTDKSGRGTLGRCDLKFRIKQTEGLWQQVRNVVKEPERLRQANVLHRLQQIGPDGRGISLGLGEVAWSAIAASWRFGYKVWFCAFDDKSTRAVLPDKAWSSSPRRGLVCLESVGQLWLPEHAARFAAVVNFCHHAGLPLWLSVTKATQPQSNTAGQGSTGSKFSQKLAAIKTNDPFSWLSVDTLSRLGMVLER